MESRRKRSRGQIVKWICYALLGLLCAVLQTTPGLFQFGAAKPLWLLPLRWRSPCLRASSPGLSLGQSAA